MSLDSIRALVQSELEATDRFILTELKSDIPLINELVEYILSCGGKRIRPLIVLLTARAFNHGQNQHINLAASLELIHTATLLHDDVVDNAALRRGQKTANSIWGSHASVLVGDFLYSRAFQLIVRLQNLKILNIFADATNVIAEGEILQMINCNNPNTTENSYFEVIQRKTAKLFEVASQTGAALSDHTSEQFAAMKDFGMNIGIAYQLIDDALDYHSSEEEIGKSIGNDLIEGKPTLPLIYALTKGSKTESKFLRDAIQKRVDKNKDLQLDKIIEIIESCGAIDYTTQMAKQHSEKARQSLKFIPDSPYRRALNDLSEFIVERSY